MAAARRPWAAWLAACAVLCAAASAREAGHPDIDIDHDGGGGGSPWSCSFTYVSLALGAFYAVVLCLVLRYLAGLWWREKRSAQKTFLFFVVLQCSFRVVYFFAWPWEGRSCHPQPVTNSFRWTDVFATVPVALFLSAFSVLTYTFSRIYHTVLRHSAVHSTLHTCYVVLVITAIAGCYGAIVVALSHGRGAGRVLLWYVVGATFCIALAFLTYGLLLYRDVAAVLREARQQNPDLPPQPNSMKRIAAVASACMACFLVRVTLLPLSEEEFGFTWLVALGYFTLSEIVPLLLMLSVFDSRATSGEQTRQQYAANEALLARP